MCTHVPDARMPPHMHEHMHIQVCTHIRIYSYTYMHTCTYTHECMNTHAVTCMHTHMHKRHNNYGDREDPKNAKLVPGVDERRLKVPAGCGLVLLSCAPLIPQFLSLFDEHT